jgi:hypothetical protein
MTERIVVGQNDEINLMSRWLRETQQAGTGADTAYRPIPWVRCRDGFTP